MRQIGNAIHRRRILEEIQRLGTCPSTASNAWSDGQSNDGEIQGNHTILKTISTEAEQDRATFAMLDCVRVPDEWELAFFSSSYEL